MLHSTELACKALGLKPKGKKSEEDFICSLCTKPVRAGELYEQLDFGSSFSAWHQIGSSKKVCGHCASCLEVKALTQGFMSSSHVITEQGVFKLKKKSHIYHWLTNPPKDGHFMINFSSAMSAHTVWNGVVNSNPNQFTFTSNGRAFTVNKEAAYRAFDLIKKISSRINGDELNKSGRIPNIFYRIDKSMTLSDIDLFRFNPTVLLASKEDSELAQWISQLKNTQTPDLWFAACVLMYPPGPDDLGVEPADLN